MATWSVENPLQVWNDQTGERYEVGPDGDGLDMVRLRFVDANGEATHDFVMPPEVWAMLKLYEASEQT